MLGGEVMSGGPDTEGGEGGDMRRNSRGKWPRHNTHTSTRPGRKKGKRRGGGYDVIVVDVVVVAVGGGAVLELRECTWRRAYH